MQIDSDQFDTSTTRSVRTGIVSGVEPHAGMESIMFDVKSLLGVRLGAEWPKDRPHMSAVPLYATSMNVRMESTSTAVVTVNYEPKH